MGAAKSRASLTWDDKQYPLWEFLEKFGVPNFVRMEEGHYGTRDATTFEVGQVFVLHAIHKKICFVGKDSISRLIAIPGECDTSLLVCPSSKSCRHDAIFVWGIPKLYPEIKHFRLLDNDSVEDDVKEYFKVDSIVKVESIDLAKCVVKFKDVGPPLPLSCRLVVEPLLDCRKYTLKDAVEAFGLPIKVRFLSSGNNDKKLENNLENAVSNVGKVKIIRRSTPELLVIATKLDNNQSLTLPKPSERCSLIPKDCKLSVSVAKGLLQNDPAYLNMVRNFNDAFFNKYDPEVLLGNKSRFRTILSALPKRQNEGYKDTDQEAKAAGQPHDCRLKPNSPGDEHENEVPLKNEHICERSGADEPSKNTHDSKIVGGDVVLEKRLSMTSQSSATVASQDCSNVTTPDHEDVTSLDHKNVTSLDQEDVTSKECMDMPAEEYLDMTGQNYLTMTGKNYVDMTSQACVAMSPQNEEYDKVNERSDVPEVSLPLVSHSNYDHDANSNENTELEPGIQFLEAFSETKRLHSEDQSAVTCPGSPTLAQLPADLSCLSVAGVVRLLTSLNMQTYVNKFQEEQIDGKILVTLDEATLCSLDLTPFHVAKLMKFIKGWRPNVGFSKE